MVLFFLNCDFKMAAEKLLWLTTVWLRVWLCATDLCYAQSTLLTFQDLLPDDPRLYDKMRPPKKNDQPTIVFFHVTVMGLDSIDENSMTYAADIFFAQTWKDFRLRLPENMTSEYRLLEVDWLKHMWRPDSFFKNAKSVTFQTMTIPNHYVWLYKDKTILYMVKLTLRLSCAMNFLIYPHDTQECKLQMESLSHTTDDLIFQWDPDVPLVVDENIELPQLEIVHNRTADCTQVYSTGNFTCLEVIFKLKRRLGYHLFNTYIPTCLIVIMSWVSFWIKPDAAPARVTLGVTSLLTLSTQHAKSQAQLPPVSYLKAVDAFMSVCTVTVHSSVSLIKPDAAPARVTLGVTSLLTLSTQHAKSQAQLPPVSYLKAVDAFMSVCTVTVHSSVSLSIKPDAAPARVTLGVTSLLTLSTQHAKSQAQLPPVSYLKAVDAFMSVCTVIKPDAVPARVTLGVTSLLTLSTQHAKSQAQLPPVSYLKAVDAFMSVCTVFVFMALMEYCLVNIVLGDGAGKPKEPAEAAKARMRAINIDRFSRVFFPLLFSVLNATYWIHFAQYI